MPFHLVLRGLSSRLRVCNDRLKEPYFTWLFWQANSIKHCLHNATVLEEEEEEEEEGRERDSICQVSNAS